jgi:hypothetical protein
MDTAVAALKKAVAFVEACAAYNRGELEAPPTPTAFSVVGTPPKG